MASPGMQKRDHRLGHPLPVSLAAELRVDEKLGHHALHALPIGGLRGQDGDDETHLAVFRHSPPDMSVLALLGKDVFEVGVQPLVRGRLASNLPPVAPEPLPELSVVGRDIVQT